MSKKNNGVIALFSAVTLAPAIAAGLTYSISIGLCVFAVLCLLFHIAFALNEIHNCLQRKEAWFMKGLSPDDKERYWYARFRG
jgi:hypothetical protein